MDNKKLVYNNEQYNVLTNINIGTTTFLICIDIFDKKIQYFKQEIVEGKIKLTSQVNLISTASDVHKKSISNKKRILDAFIEKIQEYLVKAVFVDREKVSSLFKKLPTEIENSDLKYYIIDNASIEPTDESINNLINKFSNIEISKDLNEVHQAQNELYYYNPNEEEKKVEKAVSNDNVISSNNENIIKESAPLLASDPFKNMQKEEPKAPTQAPMPDLSQTQVFANALTENYESISSSNGIEALVNKNFKEEEKIEVKKTKKRRIKRPKDNKVLYIVILAVTLLIALAGFFLLFNNKPKKYTNSEIMKQVLDTTTITESDKGELYNNVSSNKLTNTKLMNVDFNELIETNSDTVGWINFESLDINYPIVKGKTIDYYNNYSYYKTSSNDGWIHVDNDTDLLKFGYNTVIYGNTTKDNTLFSNLKNALEKDWFKDSSNHLIKLSSINSNTLWQVFSVYEIEVEDYFLTYKFKNVEEFKTYLAYMQERSVHDFDVTLDEFDKVLTLTTSKDKNTKIVVQAKLIKIEEKDEK